MTGTRLEWESMRYDTPKEPRKVVVVFIRSQSNCCYLIDEVTVTISEYHLDPIVSAMLHVCRVNALTTLTIEEPVGVYTKMAR